MDIAWFVLVLMVLAVITYFLVNLINRVITLLETLNNKIIEIEGECKPLLRDVERTLRNIEPLTKELGEKSVEISGMIDNIHRVTDDAQVTTGAIRNGVVPFAHALSGIFAGLVEGGNVLRQYTKREIRDE